LTIPVIGIGSLLALALGGCTRSVTTSDGITLYAREPEAEVRTKLGPPDFADDNTMNLGSCIFPRFRSTTGLYYLERGYVAELYKGKLCDVCTIKPESKEELEHRAAIYRGVVPTVPVGGSPEQVVALLGEPEVIEWEPHAGYANEQLCSPAFKPWMPAISVTYCYVDRGLAVWFVDGRVARAKPMWAFWQKQLRGDLESMRRRAALRCPGLSRGTKYSSCRAKRLKSSWGRRLHAGTTCRGTAS